MSEPEHIGEVWTSIANTMRAQFLAGDRGQCQALVSPENYCSGGKHGIAKDMGEGQFLQVTETVDCPIKVAADAVKRRREVLSGCPLVYKIAERYGVKWTMERPLWSQFLAAVDRERAVSWCADGKRKRQLGDLLDMVERGCRQPSKDAPHLMLIGPCGTGKTTMQAILYLAAVEAGQSCAFLDSIELRALVNNLNSRYTPTVDEADRALERLVSRDILFWSDVGDTRSTRKEFAETIAALLERFNGRLVLSSNLNPDELENHDDIGKRAVSRMRAARHGKAAVLITLAGTDQRKAQPVSTELEL